MIAETRSRPSTRDERDPASTRSGSGRIAVKSRRAEKDLAGARPAASRRVPHRRGLADPVAADQRGDGAVGGGEVHVVQHRDIAIARAKIANFQKRAHVCLVR